MRTEANVDLIGHGGAIQGNLAAVLAQGGRIDVGRYRPWMSDKSGLSYVTVYSGGNPSRPSAYVNQRIMTNATLRRDEWKQLDDALLRISEFRLGGVQDLIDKGLVYNLTNALGTTVLEYHDMSNAMEADTTMDGVSRSTGDRVAFGTNYMPLPITHSDYEINTRVLASSRTLGNPLDTLGAERAARKVMEKIEAMLFTNTTYTFGGGTIYSYINHTSRNQVTLSLAWDNASKTPQQILTDVRDMKQASLNAYHFGPWMLYIPTAYETVLDNDYYTGVSDTTKAGTSDTIRDRILKVSGIDGIKVIDTLPADNVVLVQMTSDVVRLVQGLPLQNVQETVELGMVNKYKAMTIQVPQVRADQDGNSGVTHLAA